MSLRDQAKQSIPKVLRTSFSQANALDLEKEQFEREQLNAITKALSILEYPMKEKHVRTIIIGTFKQRSSTFLWNLVSSRAPLHGNPIVCWKFSSMLHKVLREGHPNSVKEAIR
ncbi:huntingtin-interacting protein 1-like [Eurytemora carolleeae]|uniref:huntingtin-interacting protein 1-like n=1 Tax=Eurytemora carolleeae TaxID=1294199 RepID=UPI000C775466|nr:huntingtin-interacting protein 1-like [Eurytemora carolleeae]|eukprot:XP_023340359.1 huntingtin-interacting protein 1-like [Eurytemora affinis]